jgi:Serpin (serine protease inhibitor)
MSVSEIAQVMPFACNGKPAYVDESVWIPSAWPVSTELDTALRSYAEVYRGTGAFNEPIAAWLHRRNVPALANAAPIVFASVSALTYTSKWEFGGAPTASNGAFRGLHGLRNVSFVRNMHFATLEQYVECQRVVIALRDGGAAILTKAASPAHLARCLGERTKVYSSSAAATIAFPEIALANAQPLQAMLERAGVRAVFDASSNPFSLIGQRLALTTIEQSIRFRLDRYGIGVTASTISDYALSGGGRTPHSVVFDSPFAVRILDPEGNDVADAMIDDVP